MRCITLTQPWATLVTIGAKKIETRSWSTPYRGPLAIHAAKRFPNSAKTLCEARSVCRILGWPECPNPLTQEWLDDNARRIKTLPLGCVIATCQLMGCVSTDLPWVNTNGLILQLPRTFRMTDQERNFGNYEPGRYAWILEDVQALPEPIPAKGALGLWEWEQPKEREGA